MSAIFKILFFALILYFLYSWIRQASVPNQQNKPNQPGVRIFRKGKIEESKMDVTDAETIEFEEIKDRHKME